MRFSRAITGAALLALSLLSGRAELVNGIKAVVHDSVITLEDVDELTAQTADVLTRQYHNQPEVFQQKMGEAAAENLEKLLARQLILREFSSAGYSMPENFIEEAVQARIRGQFGDRTTATRTLQARGITYEKFRQQIRDQIIVSAMREKNISSGLIISPHKIDVYYQAHKDSFKVEDEVKLRIIVLNRPVDPSSTNAAALAQDLLAKLNAGESFEKLARENSQGSQRAQGGDWGWVEKSVLRKELADTAFSLKPGRHSGVIETPEAYYLMLVEDARAAHAKTLAEVREQIEKNLLLDEQKRIEKQWIDRLRKKTFVLFF